MFQVVWQNLTNERALFHSRVFTLWDCRWLESTCKNLWGAERDIPTCTIFYVRHDSVTRCWIKKMVQMFSKVAQIISTAVFTSIGLFQNSPKVNNLFWATFESEFVSKNFQKLPNLVTLIGTDFLTYLRYWQVRLDHFVNKKIVNCFKLQTLFLVLRSFEIKIVEGAVCHSKPKPTWVLHWDQQLLANQNELSINWDFK